MSGEGCKELTYAIMAHLEREAGSGDPEVEKAPDEPLDGENT
jgi:hypothetical protein